MEFEPTTSGILVASPAASLQVDWQAFRHYLAGHFRPRSVEDYYRYARRYAQILVTGNAKEILASGQGKRHHILGALSHLSRWLGCYSWWKRLQEDYGLKWRDEDSGEWVKNLLEGEDIESMLEWVREGKAKLPEPRAAILDFLTLTGLRPAEGLESIRLLKNKASGYINEEIGVLEHYRYPQIFLRRSKKAFITVLTPEILKAAEEAEIIDYQAFRSHFRRLGVETHLAYPRKIFGTWLKQHGIDSIVIDILSGRSPQTVFAQHYFRPTFRVEAEKVKAALSRLPLGQKILA